ncbi:transcriptional regulator [Asanoa ishikariensis]|uniref:Predicted ATPase n=1 Tax=Asanoa ishikariensis TaxID=137265 RepID=A0A1H3TP74_9ACTN|nr:LuxR family transcriptional regulator [Asanoa ishikariensis]GIF62104.1 transcriptional regulator [Asanoa ishikariensis]SDZ51621.1 Predicted ATPase [Asanoa ishikariensis]
MVAAGIGLVGRDAERRMLAALADDVRAGSSRVVVIRGAAGIGKTALLDDLAAHATGLRVARTTGVEFESDLPFAGLTALTRPLLTHLDELPGSQLAAFKAATAQADAVGPVDRFAVYAATLSLLAAAAEAGPLLCIVDDAHWLDRASAEALLFAARRLLAEAVLLVFATRDIPAFAAPGIPELHLDGLDASSAAELLRRGGVDSPLVTQQLTTLANGNPLALGEIPQAMTDDQRAGRVPIGDTMPTTERLERAYAAQISSLTPVERLALLTCAVAGTATLDLVMGALRELDLPVAALDAATELGLLRVSGQSVEFRHPLVRSTVHASGGPGGRRAAHAALARACSGPLDADRRAWHLAQAATGPDAAVAQALAETAERASRRGGVAAEAAAWERAAMLTPDQALSAARLVAACPLWISSGAVDHAERLIRETLLLVGDDPGTRAQALANRAYLAALRGDIDEIFDELLDAAEQLAPTAPAHAGRLISLLVNAPNRRWDVAQMLQVCSRAYELADPLVGDHKIPKVAARLAYAQVLAGLPEATPLALATMPVSAARRSDGSCAETGMVLTWIERWDEARRMFDRDVAGAREVNDISLLAYALPLRAELELRLGRLAAAYADALEGVELAEAMGQPVNTAEATVALARVEAARGAPECAAHARKAIALAPGHLGVEAYARSALGAAALAAGRYPDAVAELTMVDTMLRAGGVVDSGAVAHEGDLVEALAATGNTEEARAVAARLDASAARTGGRVPAAVAARARATLADDTTAEMAFEAALRVAGQVPAPLERGRTLLRYGQWLRRARRRHRARTHLEAALDIFETAGAAVWAEQTRAELSPSAGAAPVIVAAADALTPHEWRIAHAAAQGRTSREIAEQMLLSVRTVDYHLGNVYRKLGMRSRRDLIRRLGG